MPITAQNIFDLSMDLINKRLSNGTINPTTTSIYKARATGILTLWQNEIAKNGDFFNTYEISQKPYTNLFGYDSGFDIKEYFGTQDLSIECDGSVRTYYFEADAPCVVTIEDYTNGWNVLYTQTIPSTTTSYTAFKGTVTPTNGATRSRIRVTGGTYARITNYALFNISFYTGREPIYRPWIKYTMPSDFKSVEEIIEEFPVKRYEKSASYKWEGRKDLYINYNYEGSLRVIYKPIPITITDLAQTLQVDEITSMSGAYFLAAHLLLVEDPGSASYFNERYQDLKSESNLKQPSAEVKIEDIYGTGGF